MFTNTQLSFSKRIKTYSILTDVPRGPSPEDISRETEVPNDTSPKIDFKATRTKIDFIGKEEQKDRIKSGFTFATLNTDMLKSFDMGYMPVSATKDLFWKKPLFAPAPETQVASTQEVQKTTQYTIKPGDTLSQVAKAYGMYLSDLQKLNPSIQIKDIIRVWQSINVKGELKSPVQVASKPRVKVDQKVKEKPTEEPKTPQEKLTVAKAERKQAVDILATVAWSRNPELIERYTKELQSKAAIVEELQKIVDQQTQLAKAQEAYDKLSPNQKILADYQDALKKARGEIRSLQSDNSGLKNQDKINEIAQRVVEISRKIETCNVIIENDNKIAKINWETLAARKYYRQEWSFDLQIKNDAKVALMTKDNDRLIAMLDSGNITSTMLAKARKQNVSPQSA